MIEIFCFAKTAVKNIKITKTTIGRAARISLNSVEKCGGAAARRLKMLWAASLENTRSGMMTKKTKI